MPLANASVPRSTRTDLYLPPPGGFFAAYQGYLGATGRGNTAYTQAAKTFFRRWPDPTAWAAQPLAAKLALNGSTRPIITFLMLHHDLHPGYDYLLERKLASIWREIRTCWIGPEMDRFLDAATGLGFADRVRIATGSQVPVRLLIQTGRGIDELTLDDLAQFTAACHDRAGRTGTGQGHYLASVITTQRILFHLGVVDELPRSSGPVPLTERLADVTPGIRAQMIAYLERKKATCQAKTVTAMTSRLKHFGIFLAETDPTLQTVRDLDRRRHIEPYLTSLVDAVSDKNGAPISIGDRHRRVIAVVTFLGDITEWDWDDAPPRKVTFRDDIPKLPRVLPRYLPLDSDRRLTAALTTTPDNELAALALRLQRGCGLRIGELLDLELDCVHEIDGNGAWLKIPLGKLKTERMVPLDTETIALIDRITEIRTHGRAMPHPRYRRPAQFLFTHHGRRLGQQAVRLELDHAANVAGLDHVTSHQLRHTYATALVNAGVSLQALMALLGHVSAEMSLRYGRLFDSTVRTEYERALDLIKQQVQASAPPAAASSSGRVQLPLADITGGKDWRGAPLLKSRMAGGFCLRAPAQGACSYANICEHCPSYRSEPSSLPILAAQRVDAQALAADAEQRGWISEAQRHHQLIARLDALIANPEAPTA